MALLCNIFENPQSIRNGWKNADNKNGECNKISSHKKQKKRKKSNLLPNPTGWKTWKLAPEIPFPFSTQSCFHRSVKTSRKKYIDVNETVLRTFGFSRQEVIGKTGDELDIFVEQEKRQIALTQLTQQGYVEIFEMKFRRKDKTILDGLFSAEIIQHREKRYILVVITDITSRKLKQQIQRENEEKYRTILETTDEGYYEIESCRQFHFF